MLADASPNECLRKTPRKWGLSYLPILLYSIYVAPTYGRRLHSYKTLVLGAGPAGHRLVQKIMIIEEHVPLAPLTTFKIGGKARYFCRAQSVADVEKAAASSKEKKIPMRVLGGGSNVLIADDGFSGLVVKIDILGIEFNEHGSSVEAVVGAGEVWDDFVALCVEKGLYGVENLSGIPGTVGAAPIQNIGAYGTEVKETVLWVEVFDTKSGEVKKLTNEQCRFGYRDSMFKHTEGKSLIVVRVALRLRKTGVPNIGYKDLKEYFYGEFDSSFPKACPPISRRGGDESASRRISDKKENPSAHQNEPLPLRKGELPTLTEIREAVIEIRGRKFPDLKKFGTAGSFFKNPIIPKVQFDALKQKYPNLPGFPLESRISNLASVKVPLAWILDNVCGLKGAVAGKVGLFERQPIVLVNFADASADEVRAFADSVIRTVKEKTNIDVEWEVQSIS